MANDLASSGIAWESLISNVQPLIEEGYEITISRANEPEYEGYLVYRVTVHDHGQLVAEADSPELTEAMAEAYGSTPERNYNSTATGDTNEQRYDNY